MAKKLKAKPANLADAHMMKEMTDTALFWKISEGAGKGAMPAFKSKLKEQERWHLVNYIRAFAAHAQHGKAATQHKPASAHSPHSKGQSAKSKVTYACPMHPEVKLDKPGKCPKCGMKLEKK